MTNFLARLSITINVLTHVSNTFHLLDKQGNPNKGDFEHGTQKPCVPPFCFETTFSDQNWAHKGTTMPVLLGHFSYKASCLGFTLEYYEERFLNSCYSFSGQHKKKIKQF